MPRRFPAPLLIGGAIIGIALVAAAGFIRPVQSVLHAALLPLARGFAVVGVESGGGETEGDPAALRDRIRDLESRLTTFSVDYVKLRALEEENRSLRKVAAFLSESGYDHVGARVIARSTDAHTARVLIDRGSNDGLENGMAVIAEDGVFVGKIVSLSERVATVRLVSDEQSRLAASIAGSSGLSGLVKGEGNGVATLTLVPQTQPLERDTVVVTAGTEEKIPPNLAIALVNGVEGKPTDPFKTASLEPLARMDRLDLVVVLRPAALRPSGP